MLRTLRMLFRLLRIARTLARHDALAGLEQFGVAPGLLWLLRLGARRRIEGRPGQKLARAAAALGPSFIKLGQFASTRADILGEELATDLSELQDRLPPFSGSEARKIVEGELGQPIEALFGRFDLEPVSAASIAQVQFAVARDGTEVAVKVLRPGIERAFRRDLELFHWLAAAVEGNLPAFKRFKPVEVVRTFEAVIRIEMDLRLEAAAAQELADNFKGDATYRVPAVDWHRTSRRVLTMERVSGIPLDDREELLAAGHDIREILTKAATIFFNQVFRDGFFHGDQHPGNMWVDEAGCIVAVDFGIMGRLDKKTRAFLADMLLALLDRDYRRLAEVHIEAGYLPAGQSIDLFAQALRSIGEPIFDRPLEEISFARLLAQLLHMAESFAMPVQPQLLLLQKNMLMAEGVSRRLDPALNIWLLAQPLIEGWMREHRGPEARLRETAEQAIRLVERLPIAVTKLEAAASELADDGLKLAPETLSALAAGNRRRGGLLLWTAVLAALGLSIAALL
ncbi:MAG: 2-polyprenylphenol 6-hydroxylase [Kiloniellales bacterium]